MNPKALFPEIPELSFVPEIKFCTQCGAGLNVLKTKKRTIVTMNTGPCICHETYLYCTEHSEIHRSQDLQRLVPFKCTYGYDVLVYIGKSLYIRCMNEQAIKKELELMSIDISSSEIRYLGEKFIAYLTVCHHQSQLRLGLKMAQGGGYILHIDGTCEGDSPHLFSGMDGITGIVLSSVKINSEKKEKIIPFLKNIREQYGVPLAIVSDMGKGLMGAIEEVFPGVLSLICHFHFLRDIGKDLLEEAYRDLRNGLKKSKIRTALKNKAKDFEKKIGNKMNSLANIDSDPELASVKTALLLIHWIFDTSPLSGYGFPFDMKHLLFYQRLIAGFEKAGELYDRNGDKPFYQLIKLLSRVINDKDLKKTVQALEKNETIFNELRETLRITMPTSHQGLNDNGENCDMKSIADKMAGFLEKHESSGEKVHQKMTEQIRKYGGKLFADPICVRVGDKEFYIQPQRTNNIMEQLFRYLKRLLRRKNGKISVKRALTAMLPGTLLVKNLEKKEYLDLLLDGASGLEDRFAQIDNGLFLREFTKMKLHNKKIPPAAKKMIKEEHALEKIEELYLATAN